MVVIAFIGLVLWPSWAYQAQIYHADWTGLGRKTLWDWLQLLIAPIALAGVGYLFSRAQSNRERALADMRQQDEVLTSYLATMSDLLLDEKKNLREAKRNDAVRQVARAQTLAALRRLDRTHKRSIVEFLSDAGLLDQRPGEREDVGIVDLSGADLSGANLLYVELKGAVLAEVNLINADLRGSRLDKVNLRHANLTGADLRGARLVGSFLFGAKVTYQQLADAWICEGGVLPDSTTLPPGFEGRLTPGMTLHNGVTLPTDFTYLWGEK